MLTADLIRRGAARFPERTALIEGDESLTFAEADALANRLAHALGQAPGTRVGLLLGNSLLAVPLDFACAKAGLVRVPLNTRLAAAEQEQMLRGTEVSLLVHGAAEAERARELAAAIPALSLVALEGELVPAAEAAPADDPLVPVEPGDPLLMLYTSGTTGKLKAVVHTQASYAAICANILANLLDDVRRGDVMLHAASLIHASGTFVLPFWSRGAASAILPGFVPAEFLASIPRHRVTHANLVPTMLGLLLQQPGIEDADVSSLRTIVYGASPMPRPLLERGLALWARASSYYGQTEAPLCICVLRADEHEGDLLGSCGHPCVDCEVRLDEETGEILVRAPFAAAGTTATRSCTARRSCRTAGCAPATSAASTSAATSTSSTAPRT